MAELTRRLALDEATGKNSCFALQLVSLGDQK
jgi:hypothetical protein